MLRCCDALPDVYFAVTLHCQHRSIQEFDRQQPKKWERKKETRPVCVCVRNHGGWRNEFRWQKILSWLFCCYYVYNKCCGPRTFFVRRDSLGGSKTLQFFIPLVIGQSGVMPWFGCAICFSCHFMIALNRTKTLKHSRGCSWGQTVHIPEAFLSWKLQIVVDFCWTNNG